MGIYVCAGVGGTMRNTKTSCYWEQSLTQHPGQSSPQPASQADYTKQTLMLGLLSIPQANIS